MSSPAAVSSAVKEDPTALNQRKQRKILEGVQARARDGRRYHVAAHILYNLTYFPQGLPDAIRLILVAIHKGHKQLADHVPALVVYEVWHMALFAGVLDPNEGVTVKALVEAAAAVGWHTPRDLITKGVKQLEALGVLRVFCIYILERYREGTLGIQDSQTPEGVSKNSQNGLSTGRTPQTYYFQPVQVAITSLFAFLINLIREARFNPPGQSPLPDVPNTAWFEGDPLAAWKTVKVAEIDRERVAEPVRAKAAKVAERVAADVNARREALSMETLAAAPSLRLPVGPIRRAGDYRAAFARAIVESDPDRSISTVKAAKALGISRQSLDALYERAGVKRVAQWRAVIEINRTGGYLREQCHKAGKARAFNHPAFRFLAIEGEPTPEALTNNRAMIITGGKIDQWAAQQFRKGWRVFLAVQIHSREKLTEPQRPQREPQPPKPPQEEPKPSVQPQGDPKPARPKRAPSVRLPTVWRGFSRLYVEVQLGGRNLKDHNEGLIDLETGELMQPETKERES